MKRTGITRRPRPASDTERIYGSAERRAWIREQPCIFCRRGPSVSAHIYSRGMGLKESAESVVPMCHECHDGYDGRRPPGGRASFLAELGWTMEMVEAVAKQVARWYDEFPR